MSLAPRLRGRGTGRSLREGEREMSDNRAMAAAAKGSEQEKFWTAHGAGPMTSSSVVVGQRQGKAPARAFSKHSYLVSVGSGCSVFKIQQ